MYIERIEIAGISFYMYRSYTVLGQCMSKSFESAYFMYVRYQYLLQATFLYWFADFFPKGDSSRILSISFILP
jgi:hypothetical protein